MEEIFNGRSTAQKLVGVRELTKVGRISHHTLATVLAGKGIHDGVLTRLAEQAARLIASHESKDRETNELIEFLKLRVEKFGRAAVARELKLDPSFLARIVTGKATLSSGLATVIKRLDPIPP